MGCWAATFLRKWQGTTIAPFLEIHVLYSCFPRELITSALASKGITQESRNSWQQSPEQFIKCREQLDWGMASSFLKAQLQQINLFQGTNIGKSSPQVTCLTPTAQIPVWRVEHFPSSAGCQSAIQLVHPIQASSSSSQWQKVYFQTVIYSSVLWFPRAWQTLHFCLFLWQMLS